MNSVSKFASFFSLLCFCVGTGCSTGEFESDHDRYQNLYGFSLSGIQQGAALVGRIVSPHGDPMPWATVYARHHDRSAEPFVVTTNAKGGFLLAPLPAGDYTLIATSNTGEGLQHHFSIEDQQRIESPDLRLETLIKISGHVTLSHDPIATGVAVYVPGTPFSAFTDDTGFFFLNIPPGTYAIRSEKAAYQPFEKEEMHYDSDHSLDIAMVENPWPGGRVSVVSEDGYVVRGRTTTLQLEPVNGVRYFRIAEDQWDLTEESEEVVNRWRNIQDEVDLSYERDGRHSLRVEFMDAYGKISPPLSVYFYNTSLPAEWRILHGWVENDTTIGEGEKVAFLDSSPQVDSSDTASEGEDANTDVSPPSVVDMGSGQDASDDDGQLIGSAIGIAIATFKPGGTVFTGKLTIHQGAMVLGYASIHGSLQISGTHSQPVTWSQGGITIASPVDAQYAHFKQVVVTRRDSVQVQFQDSVFEQSTIVQTSPGSTRPTMPMKFAYSDFVYSRILFYCQSESILPTPGGPDASPVSETLINELEVKRSDFTNSHTDIRNCTDGIEFPALSRLKLTENNFYPPLGYHFLSSSGDPLPAPFPGLEYHVIGNHFESPELLYEGVGENWPEFFGENIPSVIPGTGPR